MNVACFAAHLVAWEGTFWNGEGMRAEVGVSGDLAKVRWSVEVDSGEISLEAVDSEVRGENIETFSKDTFEFVKFCSFLSMYLSYLKIFKHHCLKLHLQSHATFQFELP